MNNTSVESYLADGCGRCDKFQTPDCKVHLWTAPLLELRALLLEAGLEERMKWGSPTYAVDGQNIVMMTSLRDCCTLSFFKGAALNNDDGLLESPGPNSRYMRLLKFTSPEQVLERREHTQKVLTEAIAFARSGVKFDPGEANEPMPEELERRLDSDPELKEVFDALTPGRQRSYILHVSGAKQAETRERRVEKCIPKMLAGKGFNER